MEDDIDLRDLETMYPILSHLTSPTNQTLVSAKTYSFRDEPGVYVLPMNRLIINIETQILLKQVQHITHLKHFQGNLIKKEHLLTMSPKMRDLFINFISGKKMNAPIKVSVHSLINEASIFNANRPNILGIDTMQLKTNPTYMSYLYQNENENENILIAMSLYFGYKYFPIIIEK